MPGVIRPYTIADVIGQLNDQSQADQGSIVPLQGFFGPTNENATFSDSMSTVVQAVPAWDAGFWGKVTWA